MNGFLPRLIGCQAKDAIPVAVHEGNSRAAIAHDVMLEAVQRQPVVVAVVQKRPIRRAVRRQLKEKNPFSEQLFNFKLSTNHASDECSRVHQSYPINGRRIGNRCIRTRVNRRQSAAEQPNLHRVKLCWRQYLFRIWKSTHNPHQYLQKANTIARWISLVPTPGGAWDSIKFFR